jgi:hypothetical protein
MRDRDSTDEKSAAYMASEDGLHDEDRPTRADFEPDPEPRENDLFWPDGMPKVRHDGWLMGREWTARYWERRGGWGARPAPSPGAQ